MNQPFLRSLFLLVLLLLLVCNSTQAQFSEQLEEIIVTAEKRSEPLDEVSQSISVFDDEDLDTFAVENLVDLNALAPGVNIAKNEGVRTVVTVRGIGNEANQNAIANPSVSFHVDGIYIASAFSMQNDLVDIERIEILRGPQGTLFGQNSTGGAINIVTNQPILDDFKGIFKLSAGNFGLIRSQATVNIPVGENVAIRATTYTNRHDGFSSNPVLGQELDDADSVSHRIRLSWQVSAGTELQVNGHISDEFRNGPAQKGILDTTPDPRVLAQDSASSLTTESLLASVVLTHSLPESTIKYLGSAQRDSLVSFRDNDRIDSTDLSQRSILPAYVAPEDDAQTTTTHELQWLSDYDQASNVTWIAGVFLLDTTFDLVFRELIDFGRDGRFDPFTRDEVQSFTSGDYGFISDSSIERKSSSVYFQTDYILNDRTALVGGLRYTDDQVTANVMNFFGRSGTDRFTVSSKRITGRTTVEYQIQEDTLLYGSYLRGFKPGGNNLTYGREDTIAPILVQPTFPDEVVDVLEFGIKSDLFNKRAFLSVSTFFYAYDNMQFQATDPEVFEGGVANVPKSSVRGIEFEAIAVPHSNVQFDVRFSWLDTEVTSNYLALDNVESDTITNELLAQGFGLFGPDIQQARARHIKNVSGNQLAKAPANTATASVTHFSDLGRWGQLHSSLQYIFRGSYYHRLFNNNRTDLVGSYSVLNASLHLSVYESPWSFRAIASNITDKAGINSKFTDVFGVGATSVELIPPRQFIVGIEYRID